MKKSIMAFLMLSISFGSVQAQTKQTATDLPNISVIGNFLGTHTKNETSFDVKEIEFSFQHYLYPSVKADIFAALHKEDSGERHFELEEGYITFSDLLGVIIPDSDFNLGIGALVGKKLLNVGKINPLHPEQRDFVNRPIVIKQFLGEEEGLSPEGAQLSYLLPFDFFSQLEMGYWTASSHEEEIGEEHEESSIEYSNRIFNTRLWNSFTIDNSKELEVGFSYVIGNVGAAIDTDKQTIYGMDITYTHELSTNQELKFQSELYQALYGDDGEERASQSGGFLSGFMKLNDYYQTGIRYGFLGKHGDEGLVTNQWSILLTRQLTDTSKFKIQYNTGENVDNTLSAQFIFGMGPHSHVLQ